MSTIDRPKLAPLVAGERMNRAEFHERYEAMPSGTRVELIAGVVQMPSPAGLTHANEHAAWMGWLYVYRSRTPGVEAFDNVSVNLSEDTEVQPDSCLRIAREKGKRPRSNANMPTTPELVVEVSLSSKAIDLGPKLVECERAGTLEYVVHAVSIDQIFWHVRRDGRFVRIYYRHRRSTARGPFQGFGSTPSPSSPMMPQGYLPPWIAAWPRTSTPSSSPGWPTSSRDDRQLGDRNPGPR